MRPLRSGITLSFWLLSRLTQELRCRSFPRDSCRTHAPATRLLGLVAWARLPDLPTMGLPTRSARLVGLLFSAPCPPPANFSRAPLFSFPLPPVFSSLVFEAALRARG
eukprot:6506464-Pyramimonas_sp.AAC.1